MSTAIHSAGFTVNVTPLTSLRPPTISSQGRVRDGQKDVGYSYVPGSEVRCVGALNMTCPLTDTSAGAAGATAGGPPPQ